MKALPVTLTRAANAPVQGKGLNKSTTIKFGYPDSGKPLQLSDELGKTIRSSFGIDTSELSLRESPEVAEMGARATAQGNVIRFAPGEFRPDTRVGLEVLGHELAHVREQANGGVHAPAGEIFHDAGHEAKSDSIGSAFAAGILQESTPLSLANVSTLGSPVQMWNENVHYEDTFKWALEFFTKMEAVLIAKGDNSVDTDPRTKPDKLPIIDGGLSYASPEAFGWHFNTYIWDWGNEKNSTQKSTDEKRDSRMVHYNDQFEEALRLYTKSRKLNNWGRRMNPDGDYFYALFQFGRGLHALQDIDAHLDFKIPPYMLYPDAHTAIEQKYDAQGNELPLYDKDKEHTLKFVRQGSKMNPLFDRPEYELKKEKRKIIYDIERSRPGGIRADFSRPPNHIREEEVYVARKTKNKDGKSSRYSETHKKTKEALKKFHSTMYPRQKEEMSSKEEITPPEPTVMNFDEHRITGRPLLSKGSKGDDVYELQEKLNQLGYPLAKDKIFGAKTEDAVRSFQIKRSWLKNDGIVGPETQNSIDTAIRQGLPDPKKGLFII